MIDRRPKVPDGISSILVDPKSYADWDVIHPAYTELRRSMPLGMVEHAGFSPFWAVTRHADIQAVSQQNSVFANNGNRAGLSSISSFDEQDAMADQVPPIRSLVALDGPDHRKLRALTAAWFLPKQVKALEQKIRGISKRAVQAIIERDGEIDFVSDVALGYPLRVIMDILGVPESEEARMLQLTQEFFAPNDETLNAAKRNGDDLTTTKAVSTEGLANLAAFFGDLTEQKRRAPTDDVASLIANAQIDGKPIDDWDAISYYVTIATAGHDTTSSSTAGGMWALLENPDQLALLKADPSRIPGFVDESIRWTTPIQSFMRTCMADADVGGQSIRAGDWLMLCYPSGNRDEAVFKDPFVFDHTRAPNRHVAFGYGGHLCLGMHLAKLEMRIFFEEFFSHLKSAELVGPPQRVASVFIGGPKSLPVRLAMSPQALTA